jgi:hypothetical protein
VFLFGVGFTSWAAIASDFFDFVVFVCFYMDFAASWANDAGEYFFVFVLFVVFFWELFNL